MILGFGVLSSYWSRIFLHVILDQIVPIFLWKIPRRYPLNDLFWVVLWCLECSCYRWTRRDFFSKELEKHLANSTRMLGYLTQYIKTSSCCALMSLFNRIQQGDFWVGHKNGRFASGCMLDREIFLDLSLPKKYHQHGTNHLPDNSANFWWPFWDGEWKPDPKFKGCFNSHDLQRSGMNGKVT